MKRKYFVALVFMSLVLVYCGDKNNTVPDGKGDVTEVETGTTRIMLGDKNFHCDYSSTAVNPCYQVFAGDGKLQITIVGTVSSWKNTVQYENSSYPNPTSQINSPGTNIYGNSSIWNNGCITYEYPKGEDYKIYVDFIEGGNIDCSPVAVQGCWQWSHNQVITEDFPTFFSCNDAEEYVIDISSVTPQNSNCSYPTY